MKQYLDLLQNIIDNGVEKESGRANMPNTIGISHGVIRMNLQDGFPLLTTKKMFWKGIIHELLWILRGDTNIKYLVDNKVNIWNGDAYRWYLKWWDETGHNVSGYKKIETIENFIELIKNRDNNIWWNQKYLWKGHKQYMLGDLGSVYGYQWRNQNGVDQVKKVVEELKNNPYSRYHIINAWNVADFKDMALPPCHLMYQFIVRPLTYEQRIELFLEKNEQEGLIRDKEYGLELCDNNNIPKFYLDLNMYQRSVDSALGCPFNLASMSLLLMIVAKTSNMISGVATWIGGDTHIYINHIDAVKEQLKREPLVLPKLLIKKELNNLEDILALTIENFELVNYKSYSKIDFELFTGNKK
jgi:thymidylate synthase